MAELGVIEHEPQYILVVQDTANGLVDANGHSVDEIAVHFVNGIEYRFIGLAVHELFGNLRFVMSFAECTPSTDCKCLQLHNALTVAL